MIFYDREEEMLFNVLHEEGGIISFIHKSTPFTIRNLLYQLSGRGITNLPRAKNSRNKGTFCKGSRSPTTKYLIDDIENLLARITYNLELDCSRKRFTTE